MNAAIRDNGWGYWLHLLVRTAQPRYSRTFSAWLRSVGWVLRGYYGETCQQCGRRYPLWDADEVLWWDVIARRAGLFCPACFTDLAAERSMQLWWEPKQAPRRGAR